MNNRDDFTQKTKDILSERVGGKCSNPNCRRETKGPHSDNQKRVSIGQAAHITAAAEGGPRFNENLTKEKRKDIDNGIWLCESCAKMIDNDEKQYPVQLFILWKSMAEYEQQCIINQTVNCFKTNVEFENRKNIACRKIKEALDNLHNILEYAYEFWMLNFDGRFEDVFLENELSRHWVLYKENLEYIYKYQEMREVIDTIKLEYSLDLGEQLCDEIKKYCSNLEFSHLSDNCGLYNNYWKCFFDMISTKFNLLVDSKIEIDKTIYQMYSM